MSLESPKVQENVTSRWYLYRANHHEARKNDFVLFNIIFLLFACLWLLSRVSLLTVHRRMSQATTQRVAHLSPRPFTFRIFVVQASAHQPYLDAIRATLQAAFCIENFESQVVERHNKPEVEVKYASASNPSSRHSIRLDRRSNCCSIRCSSVAIKTNVSSSKARSTPSESASQ